VRQEPVCSALVDAGGIHNFTQQQSSGRLVEAFQNLNEFANHADWR
jgi:hypothetical protein